MRALLAGVLVAAILPTSLSSQGLQESSLILAPHSTAFTIGSGAAKRSVTQTAIPLVFTLPVSARLSVDLTTAYAVSDVIVNGASTSSIHGLTDTQMRANFSVGSDLLVFTVGLNLPTGQYTIPPDQQEAAGQIGNDFLNYTVSSMGNGFAGTGGVAYARALGSWNLGLGASVRKSAEFAAFEVNSAEFRFTPADEYRVRAGVDRPVGDGQVAFGLSFSSFGEDIADTTSYSTGDRIIATGSWSFPVRDANVFVSGWNLYRSAGTQLGGAAETENVANMSAAVSFETRSMLIQPSVETRLWQIGGARAGLLTSLGVRLRFAAGTFSFYPSAGYSIGSLYSTVDGSALDVTGMRGSLTIRWN